MSRITETVSIDPPDAFPAEPDRAIPDPSGPAVSEVTGGGAATDPPAGASDAGLPALTVGCRALGLLGLEGWSVGVLLGVVLLKGDLERFVTQNAVAMPVRQFMLRVAFAGAALAFAAGVAFLAVNRRRPGAAQRLDSVARRLSPLCLAGFLPFLFHWRFWVDRDLQFLVAVAAFSLAAWGAARAALSSPPLLASLPRVGGWLTARLSPLAGVLHDVAAGRRWRRLPLAIVVVAAAAYTALFSAYTITNHRNLRTAAFDLGLEDNLVWNILHGIGFFRSTTFGGPEGSHFGNHATFFSYVIAPFYALSQGAEALLFIQALLIGAAAVPLFLLARRQLTPWMACVIAVAYLLYPPVHGANLYEFHYVPLGAFFLWSTLYLFEERRDRWAVVMTILALSVREDIGPAAVSVLGAYLLISGKRPRAGAIVAAVGALGFVLLKLVFMPMVAGLESFTIFYKDLFANGEQSFSAVMKTVLGNPFYTLGTLLERAKLVFLLQFFVPLAFLPLRRPIVLLLIVPGFFFTLLSTGYQPLIEISFQYTFFWTVFLFIGVIETLAYFRRSAATPAEGALRARAALIALCCAMLPVSYQVGAVFQRHTARSGFGHYDFETTPRNLEDRAALAEIVKAIPPRGKVAASDSLTPHISNRPVAYTLRGDIGPDVEYLLFFADPGRIDGGERGRVSAALLSGAFGVVDLRGAFAVAKRGQPPSPLNDVLLRRWGIWAPPHQR